MLTYSEFLSIVSGLQRTIRMPFLILLCFLIIVAPSELREVLDAVITPIAGSLPSRVRELVPRAAATARLSELVAREKLPGLA